MKLRLLLVIPILALLAACISMSKVGPGTVTVKDLTFTLDGPWNKLEGGGQLMFPRAPGATEIWTREGFALDVLAFYAGIGENEQIGMSLASTTKKLPVYRAKMAPHEIVEAYETAITQDGSAFTMGKLEPARFGGGEGFRFEYTLRRKGDSLVFNGIGYGTVANRKLYLMTFSAPRMHYFPQLLPGAEAAAKSANIKR
jgi:hypothetical protein